MRIVILISVFARGGAERQAYLLARELKQRHGLDVEVWALCYGGEYQREFEAAGIPTNVIGFRWPRAPWRMPRQFPRVVRHLRQARIGVLLPFTTWPNVVAGLTYRMAGIRLCIWGERHAGGERIPGFERIALTQYSRFVANSTAGVEFLATEMRVPRKRISFVPNGVEVPQIDTHIDWRAKLGLRLGQSLVVKVANLTKAKDHKTLLHAWKIVQDNWPLPERPVLALAGRHDEAYDKSERLVADLELRSVVRFLGTVTDVPTLVQACDVAAFSSVREGMPNGVLECMAAGKAVVATDLPGIRDALGPGADNSVVPPCDPARFAARLLELLADKGRRDALGKANSVRIAAEFSVERMAEQHLRIIQTSMPTPPGKVAGMAEACNSQ